MQNIGLNNHLSFARFLNSLLHQLNYLVKFHILHIGSHSVAITLNI